jgi:hypothetical protein
MASPLREPLSPEQQTLIGIIGEPFIASGELPVWQYVDLILDGQHRLDAASVLASLPDAGDRSPTSRGYALIWRPDSYRQPLPDDKIALTAAGLLHLPTARPLLDAFLTMIRYLVDRQRQLIPSPREVVTATVTDGELAEHLRGAGIPIAGPGVVDETLLKLRIMLGHEPFLYAVVHQPTPSEPWTIQVPAILRDYRNAATVEDYIDQVTELVTPAVPPSVPPSIGALDVPYAVGYLDAVWMNRTGSHLFVSLDPASVGRLTQDCGSEEEFNSLMSALADVLGQTVVPGMELPPQRGALEAVRDYLTSSLGADAADRVIGAFQTLIRLRQIRVSTQHADARHRAVTSFQEIGLPFPPVSWDQAWRHIAILAMGALDTVREEVHAGTRY